MRGGLRLVAVGFQVGAVVLGHFWGVATHYPGRPPSMYTVCAFVAIVTMLAGTLVTLLRQPPAAAAGRSLISLGSLAYSLVAMLFEPFLSVHELGEVVVAALILVPLLLAIGYLVRARAWLSAVGVTLFVFVSSAMITSNASVSDAGSGFFGWWIS